VQGETAKEELRWLYKVSDGKLMGAEFFGDTAQARDAVG
jgi:hypothetical protein